MPPILQYHKLVSELTRHFQFSIPILCVSLVSLMNNMEISQLSNDDQSQSFSISASLNSFIPFPTVYFVCSAIDCRVIGIISVCSQD